MGSKRCDSLFDIKHLGCDVYLRCLDCGHKGVLGVDRAITIFMRQNWNMALEVAGSRFCCSICSGKRIDLQAGSKSEHGRREWTRGARR